MSGRRAAVRPDAAVRGLFLTSGFVIAAFFPFLALFLADKGLSDSQIGFVIAAMALARILLNPIWGHLADSTLGRRTSLQIGLLAAAACALLLAGAQGMEQVTIAGFLLTGAMVTFGPNIDAITMTWALGKAEHGGLLRASGQLVEMLLRGLTPRAPQ